MAINGIVPNSPINMYGPAPTQPIQTNAVSSGVKVYANDQFGGGFSEQSDISQLGVMGAKIAGGVWIGLKEAPTIAKAIMPQAAATAGTATGTGLVSGALNAIKGIGSTIGRATGISAVLSGAISAITNGMDVANGTISMQNAVGNVAADTAGGALSGVAAAALGGLTVAGLTMAGLGATAVGGVLIPVLGVGAGILGALGADIGFKGSGVHAWISNKVRGLIGG